jgi:hypothetical protein
MGVVPGRRRLASCAIASRLRFPVPGSTTQCRAATRSGPACPARSVTAGVACIRTEDDNRSSPQRYSALPSTTPDRDSLFAKQSRSGNRFVSHHALASSAVENRRFITVIHD